MCIFNVLLKPIPWTRNDHNLASPNKGLHDPSSGLLERPGLDSGLGFKLQECF